MIDILEGIVKQLAMRINDLGFVSKSGGLLYEFSVSSGGANTVRTTAQIAPFVDGKLVPISPDKKETVITFFQAGPTRVLKQDLYLSQLENELTLTGWVNGDRIGREELGSPEVSILNEIRKFKSDLTTGGPLRDIEIDYSGDSEGQAPASRWGWDKPEFQYGSHPHRIFQLKFRLTYMVSKGCATQTVHVLNPAC